MPSTNRSIYIICIAVALGIIRLLYVFVEGSYNLALLDLMATPLLTSDEASSVQELGHKLAALGLALLITPLAVAYALKQVVGIGKKIAHGAILSVAVFLAVYVSGFNLQKWIMDTAVESTSAEVRYDAYYEVLFRQLYVDGAIVDDGFKASIENGRYAMWLPFAWGSITDLPDTLQDEASALVMERARKQVALERFEKDYEVYRQYQGFTEGFLEKYRSVSDEALVKTDPVETSLENLYGSLVERVYSLYPAYQSVNEEYREHLTYMASNGWLRADIRKMFSASVNEREYRHRTLLRTTGLSDSDLEANDWCSSVCPGDVRHLRTTIKQALNRMYADRAYGVPMGLDLNAFLTSPEAFNQALKRKGLSPAFHNEPVSFGVFKAAMSDANLNADVSETLSRWFPQVKDVQVPAGLSDDDILSSDTFRRLVTERVGSKIASFPVTLSKQEFFQQWLRLSSEALEGKRDVLLPQSPEQMLERDNVEAGLSAVRLLYIPPFAATVSALMIALNLAAVISGLVVLRRRQWFLRFALLAALASSAWSVSAFEEMPSQPMQNTWELYQQSNPVSALMWEVFFGFESVLTGVTGGGERVLSAERTNVILDKSLGWAL